MPTPAERQRLVDEGRLSQEDADLLTKLDSIAPTVAQPAPAFSGVAPEESDLTTQERMLDASALADSRIKPAHVPSTIDEHIANLNNYLRVMESHGGEDAAKAELTRHRSSLLLKGLREGVDVGRGDAGQTQVVSDPENPQPTEPDWIDTGIGTGTETLRALRNVGRETGISPSTVLGHAAHAATPALAAGGAISSSYPPLAAIQAPFLGPLAPVAAAGESAIIGGIAAALAGKGEDSLLKLMAPEALDWLAKSAQQDPAGATVGNLAGSMVAARPSLSSITGTAEAIPQIVKNIQAGKKLSALGEGLSPEATSGILGVGGGAAMGAATEAGRQALAGKLDVGDILSAGATGAALTKPTGIGERTNRQFSKAMSGPTAVALKLGERVSSAIASSSVVRSGKLGVGEVVAAINSQPGATTQDKIKSAVSAGILDAESASNISSALGSGPITTDAFKGSGYLRGAVPKNEIQAQNRAALKAEDPAIKLQALAERDSQLAVFDGPLPAVTVSELKANGFEVKERRGTGMYGAKPVTIVYHPQDLKTIGEVLSPETFGVNSDPIKTVDNLLKLTDRSEVPTFLAGKLHAPIVPGEKARLVAIDPNGKKSVVDTSIYSPETFSRAVLGLNDTKSQLESAQVAAGVPIEKGIRYRIELPAISEQRGMAQKVKTRSIDETAARLRAAGLPNIEAYTLAVSLQKKSTGAPRLIAEAQQLVKNGANGQARSDFIGNLAGQHLGPTVFTPSDNRTAAYPTASEAVAAEPGQSPIESTVVPGTFVTHDGGAMLLSRPAAPLASQPLSPTPPELSQKASDLGLSPDAMAAIDQASETGWGEQADTGVGPGATLGHHEVAAATTAKTPELLPLAEEFGPRARPGMLPGDGYAKPSPYNVVNFDWRGRQYANDSFAGAIARKVLFTPFGEILRGLAGTPGQALGDATKAAMLQRSRNALEFMRRTERLKEILPSEEDSINAGRLADLRFSKVQTDSPQFFQDVVDGKRPDVEQWIDEFRSTMRDAADRFGLEKDKRLAYYFARIKDPMAARESINNEIDTIKAQVRAGQYPGGKDGARASIDTLVKQLAGIRKTDPDISLSDGELGASTKKPYWRHAMERYGQWTDDLIDNPYEAMQMYIMGGSRWKMARDLKPLYDQLANAHADERGKNMINTMFNQIAKPSPKADQQLLNYAIERFVNQAGVRRDEGFNLSGRLSRFLGSWAYSRLVSSPAGGIKNLSQSMNDIALYGLLDTVRGAKRIIQVTAAQKSGGAPDQMLEAGISSGRFGAGRISDRDSYSFEQLAKTPGDVVNHAMDSIAHATGVFQEGTETFNVGRSFATGWIRGEDALAAYKALGHLPEKYYDGSIAPTKDYLLNDYDRKAAMYGDAEQRKLLTNNEIAIIGNDSLSKLDKARAMFDPEQSIREAAIADAVGKNQFLKSVATKSANRTQYMMSNLDKPDFARQYSAGNLANQLQDYTRKQFEFIMNDLPMKGRLKLFGMMAAAGGLSSTIPFLQNFTHQGGGEPGVGDKIKEVVDDLQRRGITAAALAAAKVAGASDAQAFLEKHKIGSFSDALGLDVGTGLALGLPQYGSEGLAAVPALGAPADLIAAMVQANSRANSEHDIGHGLTPAQGLAQTQGAIEAETHNRTTVPAGSPSGIAMRTMAPGLGAVGSAVGGRAGEGLLGVRPNVTEAVAGQPPPINPEPASLTGPGAPILGMLPGASWLKSQLRNDEQAAKGGAAVGKGGKTFATAEYGGNNPLLDSIRNIGLGLGFPGRNLERQDESLKMQQLDEARQGVAAREKGARARAAEYLKIGGPAGESPTDVAERIRKETGVNLTPQEVIDAATDFTVSAHQRALAKLPPSVAEVYSQKLDGLRSIHEEMGNALEAGDMPAYEKLRAISSKITHDAYSGIARDYGNNDQKIPMQFIEALRDATIAERDPSYMNIISSHYVNGLGRMVEDPDVMLVQRMMQRGDSPAQVRRTTDAMAPDRRGRVRALIALWETKP